jgi:cob(I)alamin adenosyltransferase
MNDNETDKARRHAHRMKRRKQVVDAAIERANEERGIIVLLTGNGKGKSSSAFGMLARALGHGQRAGVIQFIKGGDAAGEQRFFASLDEVEYHVMGTGFTWETQNRDKDIQAGRKLWEKARAMLANPLLDLVILDELTYMFQFDYLPWPEVRDAILARPREQSLVITGRGARPELIELADTVSEIQEIKHAFAAGIKARKGIEF